MIMLDSFQPSHATLRVPVGHETVDAPEIHDHDIDHVFGVGAAALHPSDCITNLNATNLNHG
jgi:hypothetical protein